MDDTVAAYRTVNRERGRAAAWILFEQNRDRIEQLEEALRADAARPNSPLLKAFVARLESNTALRDPDKLAFRDLLDDLAHLSDQGTPSASLRQRITDDAAALEQVQTLYQKEIAQIFSGFQTRGMAIHREAWDDYVAFLKTRYTRESVLKESESQLPPAESRGGAAARSKLEITGAELPPKTVALTFDDGPHPRYTDQVLAILKKYGLHAVFFEVGKTLGTVNADNQVTLGPGTEGGDFIFNLNHETEFLSGDSLQLDDQGIKVNADVQKRRDQMRDKERKKEELRKQLATPQAQLKQGIQPAPAATLPIAAATNIPPIGPATIQEAAVSQPPDPAGANDEGMRLYKEKRYAEAAAKFSEAATLQPTTALFANNAGFAYYRMAQYDEAAKWFLRTIALDPKRAIAYLNLSDAYVSLQKKSEARDACQKYLALSPNSKTAPEVRAKLHPR